MFVKQGFSYRKIMKVVETFLLNL